MKSTKYWAVLLALGGGLGAMLSQSAAQNSPESLSSHPGWMLAAGCFACHGTDGRDSTFGKLAGKSVEDLIEEMQELKSANSGDAAIMKVHALGYTDAQIKLLADYFSKLNK